MKAHTVSLAPPNAPRGQNEINNNKGIAAFPSLYAISKHPFGELNVA